MSHTNVIQSRPALSAHALDRWVIMAVRIAVGILWVGNSGWKVPTNFRSLEGFLQAGVDSPTLGIWSWGLEHIALEYLTLFGFITVVTETLLGALILLGWMTRWVALGGALQSLAIGLTVSNVEHEWPWAYWLMVGVHLLLFATDAGRYGGLDDPAVRARPRNALRTIGGALVVVGLWSGLTAGGRSTVLEVIPEVQLFRSTLAGGLVLAAMGVLVVVGAEKQLPQLLKAVAALAALFVALTYLLWRDDGSYPLGLGYDGRAIAVLLMTAIGVYLLTTPRSGAGAGAAARSV